MKRTFIATAFLLLLGAKAQAGTTTLSGTIVDTAGNPLNGRITFVLPVSVTDTTTHQAVAPTATSYAIRNGQFPPGATVIDTTTVSPSNVYLTAYLYDVTGTLISISNYAPVTGNPFNIGLAVPVTVTTSSISWLTPASLTVLQTWTALQNFSQGITVGTGVTNTGTGLKHVRVTTGSIGAGARADVTVAWPGTAFSNTSYTPVCSVLDSTTGATAAGLVLERVASVAAGSIHVTVLNGSGGSLTGTVSCTALHD